MESTEIVNDLNITLSKNFAARIDLLRWNKHCYPSVGQYPQAVVNSQIGNDYDIFIGIIWKKFGTPTPVASSGTEEEFQRAYAKYQQDPTSVKILFYFRDAGTPSLSELDPDQLRRIQQFRLQLGEKGSLYYVYRDQASFKRYVRLHLDLLVSELVKQKSANVPTTNAIKSASPSQPEAIECKEIEEDGFFDLIVIGQDSFSDLTEISNRITITTVELGNKLTERSREIDAIKTPSGYNAKAMRRICDRAAEDLDGFADRLKADTPTFAKIYKKGIDSFGKAYGSTFNGMNVEESNLDDSLEATINLKDSLIDAFKKITSFRNVIDKIPSATRTLIRSRKHVVAVMDEFVSEFDTAINLTAEMEKIIAKRIQEKTEQKIIPHLATSQVNT